MSAPGTDPVAEAGFEIVRRSPSGDLAGAVIEMVGYRETNAQPVRQVEAASLVVPLIISFGEPFEIALGREPCGEDRYASFTAGLCTAPALIRSHGAAYCVQVNFTPPGACRFFGRPVADLAERMVRIDDLGERWLPELRERLGEQRCWAARFSLVEAAIRERLAQGRRPPSAFAWAYEQIVASGGGVRISRLAGRLECSRKHLSVLFRRELGLPPKAVAKIARFERTRRMATARGDHGWAEIAAACGYADQAHLARDFRRFSGTTPALWRSRDAP